MSSIPAPQPVEIRRIGKDETPPYGALHVVWSDGAEHILGAEPLRRACPCATCLEARGDTTHAKPLGGKSSLLRVVAATADESLELQQIWSVGNYAIGLRWGDGHDTGIYAFSYLRDLGERAQVV